MCFTENIIEVINRLVDLPALLYKTKYSTMQSNSSAVADV